MGPDHYGLVPGPAKVKLFGLAIGVHLAGGEHAAVAHARPVALGHRVEHLKAPVAVGGACDGAGEAARRDAELIELFARRDAVVIKEQQAA